MTASIIWATALSALSFLAANAYAACLLSLPGNPIANLAAALRRLPLYIMGHGPLSLEAAALATGLVAACSVWCAWAWSLTHGRAQRQGEEHGSARWGTVREGRRFMNLKDPDQNVILTERFGMAMSRPDHDRRHERNRNVLVVGGSGAGKTRGFFEPNVMQMSANYLVTDPKGESLPRLGHMLEAGGYEILSFNTVDFSKSLHYNPLAYVADEADILEFVACLIDNTTGDKEHAGDPFWENAERLLYVALIGYLIYHCPPDDRSLSGLVTLLSLAKAKESDEDYRSPLDLLFDEVETGMRYVRRAGEPEGFDPLRRESYNPGGTHRWVRVSEPVAVDADFCLLHYKMFKDAAGKTLKSILVSCNTRMEPFAIPQVRELVSFDEMGLDRLGGRGRAPRRVRRHVGHLLALLVPLRHHDVADHERPVQEGARALRRRAAHAGRHAHGRVRQHRPAPRRGEDGGGRPQPQHLDGLRPAIPLAAQERVQRRRGHHRRLLRHDAVPRGQVHRHGEGDSRVDRQGDRRHRHMEREPGRVGILNPQLEHHRARPHAARRSGEAATRRGHRPHRGNRSPEGQEIRRLHAPEVALGVPGARRRALRAPLRLLRIQGKTARGRAAT